MHQLQARSRPKAKPWTVLCACFLLGWATLTVAVEQTNYPQPKNFNITESPVTDLLSQKSISELFEDSSGFLWIRTQDGIHRYDGYEIRSFYPNEDGLGALGHGGGPQITEDQSGTIWLATLGKGLVFYDRYKKNFQSVLAPKDGMANQAPYDLSTIYSSKSGAIWLGYLDGNVHRFNPLSKQVDRKLVLNREPGSIVGIVEDDSRQLWIATSTGNLFSCAPMKTKCSSYKKLAPLHTEPGRMRFSSLTIDHLGRIWLGTAQNGVFLIDELDQKVTRFKHVESQQDSITHNSIQRIFRDKQGRMWIGTDKGLNVYLGAGKFKRFDSTNSYLDDYIVLSLHQDQNNILWIGTHFGLYIGTESLFETINENRGLPSNIITAFSEHPQKGIFVATYNGLFLQKSISGVFSRIEIPGFKLRDSRVMSIRFSDPYLWIGYRSHGLDVVNFHSGNHYKFEDQIRNFRSGSVSDILNTESGSIVVATFGDGVYTFSGKFYSVDNFRKTSLVEHGLSSNKIFSLTETQDSDILIGTLRGLNHYSIKKQEITHIAADRDYSDFLNDTQILTIAEDEKNNIWMGSQNAGLILWRQADRLAGRSIFTRVKTTPPMPSSTLYAIEMDDSGQLWISTTNGLVRLNPETLDIVTFDRSDGLQDNEFNFGASFKDSDGKLYFGGNRGFNRFSPEDIVLDTTPPPLRMTDIDIAGKTLAMDVSYVDVHALDLSFKQYFVSFEFSALDFTNPANNRYKYKLDNFDDDWVDIGTRHNVSFTNLPPGKFTLRVSGANSAGIWNNDGILIPINVYPPPWFRWWAFTLYGSFLVCIGVLIRKLYDTYQLKEQATELAAEFHNTAELAMDDLEDQIEMEQVLVRNLHNHSESTLKLVSGFLEKQADSIDDDVILDAFEDSQQRLACLQLIEDNMIYTAQFLEVDFHSFLEDLFAQIFPLDTPPELEVVPINDAPDQVLEVSIAIPIALISNELVMNSAKHAFKGATGVQTVRVHVQEKIELNGWILEVFDSGSGLPTDIDPYNPTTTGMEIVSRFCQELNAVITVDRNRGTRFRFEIPRLKPDHSDS